MNSFRSPDESASRHHLFRLVRTVAGPVASIESAGCHAMSIDAYASVSVRYGDTVLLKVAGHRSLNDRVCAV